jgi:hypothetical protein
MGFKLFLHFCYNHTLSLTQLSIDQLLALGTTADRFLCPRDLTARMKHTLYNRFSVINALKIYLWVRRFHPEDTSHIERLRRGMLHEHNLRLVFHQGVF